MDKPRFDDLGFHAAEPVRSQPGRRWDFSVDVAGALAALRALRVRIDEAGPDIVDHADDMAEALSGLDSALGEAVVALHEALDKERDAA